MPWHAWSFPMDFVLKKFQFLPPQSSATQEVQASAFRLTSIPWHVTDKSLKRKVGREHRAHPNEFSFSQV